MKTPHDFFLVSSEEAQERWSDYASRRSPVFLTDEVVLYISDTLKWIPSWNPARRKERTGLCYHGPTVFSGRGALQVAELMERWCSVFALGPEHLELTSGTILNAKGNLETERFGVARDELTRQLSTIAAWGRIASRDDQVLLTMGI